MKHPLRIFAVTVLAVATLALAGCGSDEPAAEIVDIGVQEATPTPEFQAFPDEAATPVPETETPAETPAPEATLAPTAVPEGNSEPGING